MTLRRGLLRSAGGKGVALLMDDQYTGTPANIVGRTPDTVDPGDTWKDTGWNSAVGTTIQAGNGVANLSGGTATIMAARIDVASDDKHIVYRVESEDTSANADNFLFARIVDLVDNGFPTDSVFAAIEHDTNNITITERVSSVSNTIASGSMNAPENTAFDVVFSTFGSSVRLCVPSLSFVLNGTVATHVTGGNMGIAPRTKSFFRRTRVYDAVSIDYVADGVLL